MSENPSIPEALIPAQKAKLEAEALSFSALAEFHRANAALAAATARKNEAEAEAFEAEVDGRRAQTQIARLNADMTERENAKHYASDSEHNVYRFTGAVSDDSVAKAMRTITTWSRLKPGEPIEIIFYSPGGSVTAGLAFWDYIQDLKRLGHVITTTVNGMAASMAGILLQAGSVRVMGKESWLMIHEVSFGAQGKIGDIEDTVGWIKMVQERVKQIFADRSTLSVADVEDLWRRKDCWLSSDDALAKGLVDVVR